MIIESVSSNKNNVSSRMVEAGLHNVDKKTQNFLDFPTQTAVGSGSRSWRRGGFRPKLRGSEQKILGFLLNLRNILCNSPKFCFMIIESVSNNKNKVSS